MYRPGSYLALDLNTTYWRKENKPECPFSFCCHKLEKSYFQHNKLYNTYHKWKEVVIIWVIVMYQENKRVKELNNIKQGFRKIEKKWSEKWRCFSCLCLEMSFSVLQNCTELWSMCNNVCVSENVTERYVYQKQGKYISSYTFIFIMALKAKLFCLCCIWGM